MAAEDERPSRTVDEESEGPGVPDDDLDEADRRLLELEKELEDESQAAKLAGDLRELRKDAEAAARTVRRKGGKPPPRAEDEEDADDEDQEEDDDQDREADDDEAPDQESDAPIQDKAKKSKGKAATAAAELKAKVKAEASTALTEVLTETISSKKSIGEAAVDVVQRRLPAMPSRQKVRNTALVVAGVGLASWFALPIVGTILSWIWFGVKAVVIGSVLYGGWWFYRNLPEDETSEAEGGKADKADKADKESEP